MWYVGWISNSYLSWFQHRHDFIFDRRWFWTVLFYSQLQNFRVIAHFFQVRCCFIAFFCCCFLNMTTFSPLWRCSPGISMVFHKFHIVWRCVLNEITLFPVLLAMFSSVSHGFSPWFSRQARCATCGQGGAARRLHRGRRAVPRLPSCTERVPGRGGEVDRRDHWNLQMIYHLVI